MKAIRSLCVSTYEQLSVEFQKRVNCAHRNVNEQTKLMAARSYAFLSQQYLNALLTEASMDEKCDKKKAENQALNEKEMLPDSRRIKATGIRKGIY